MSGPKIVRTVTRAERIEQARVQIAMIDEAIKRWRLEVAVHGRRRCSTGIQRSSPRSRRVETLLASDRFEEIAPRTNSIVASVDDDIDRMRDEQYVRRARVLERERSTRFTAKGLLDRSREAGVAISEESRGRPEEPCTRGIERRGEAQHHRRPRLRRDMLARNRETPSNEAQELAKGVGRSGGIQRRPLDSCERRRRKSGIRVCSRRTSRLPSSGTWRSRGRNLLGQSPRESLYPKIPATTARGSAWRWIRSAWNSPATVRQARRLAELRRALSREIAAAEATNDLEACRQQILEAEVEINRRQLDRAEERITKLREAREACVRTRATQCQEGRDPPGAQGAGVRGEGGNVDDLGRQEAAGYRTSEPARSGVGIGGQCRVGAAPGPYGGHPGCGPGPGSDREVEERWCGELKTLQDSLAKSGGTVSIERVDTCWRAPPQGRYARAAGASPRERTTRPHRPNRSCDSNAPDASTDSRKDKHSNANRVRMSG